MKSSELRFLPARKCIFTVIDFETTGTVYGWDVEPWQIGMCSVSVTNGICDGFSRWLHVSADRPFNRFAPGRHALIRDQLDAASTLPQLWSEIAVRLTERPVVAHNISTEKNILRKAAPLHVAKPWIDTLVLSRRYYPGLNSYALEDLIETLALKPAIDAKCPGLAPHDAYYDAVACGMLLLHFLSLPGWDNVALAGLM